MSLLLALLLTLVTGSAADAATIQVSPAPGTPLQDAITAAAPGDKLIVNEGDYRETVVVAKSLKIVTVGGVRIGPELGALQSSCAPAFVMDVTAGKVSLEGKKTRAFSGMTIQGGGAGVVRVGGQARVKLRRVSAFTFCPGADGLVVQGVASLKASLATFTSNSSTLAGGAGCRLSQAGAGKIVFNGVRCDGSIAGFGNYNGGPGLLVENDPPLATAAPVKIVRSVLVSFGNAGAVLHGAGHVRITRSYLEAKPVILGGPPYFSVMLDADSTANAVSGSTLVGPPTDAGTGNCLQGNVDGDGNPLPDACS